MRWARLAKSNGPRATARSDFIFSSTTKGRRQYCVVPDIPGLTSSCFLSVLVLVPRAFRFARDDFAFQSLDRARIMVNMAHPPGGAFPGGPRVMQNGMRLGCAALRFHI